MSWPVRIVFGLVMLGLSVITGLRTLAPDTLPAALTPPRLQVQALLDTVQRDEGPIEISDALSGDAAKLARAHPLDPTPYTLAQFRALQAGDVTAANRAALTALRLQPRTRAARMHLINALVARGRYDEAFNQITLLWQTDRTGHRGFAEAIVRLAQDPRSWPALDAAIAQDPPWKTRALRSLASEATSLELLKSLFRHWPEGLNVLLRRLIEEGEMDAAYLSFASALPPDAPLTAPYDPEFAGLAGAPPFNWSLDERYMEETEGPGLGMIYFGRGRTQLLRQVFPVSPGAYDFSYGLTGQAAADAARFEWRFSCASPRQRLLSAPAEYQPTSGSPAPIRLTVPDTDCDYIELALLALPGLYPQTSRLRLTHVALSPASAEDD